LPVDGLTWYLVAMGCLQCYLMWLIGVKSMVTGITGKFIQGKD
jgi:hypothetical protein